MLSLGQPDLARWSLSLLAEEAMSDLGNESSILLPGTSFRQLSNLICLLQHTCPRRLSTQWMEGLLLLVLVLLLLLRLLLSHCLKDRRLRLLVLGVA